MPAYSRRPCQPTSIADFVNLMELTHMTSVTTVSCSGLGWYSYQDLGSTGDSMEAEPKWMQRGGAPSGMLVEAQAMLATGVIYHTFPRMCNLNIVEAAPLQADIDYNEDAATMGKKDKNSVCGLPDDLLSA